MNWREKNILIVDDYQSVREMVTFQLKELGHQGQLWQAESVDEAWQMFKTPQHDIDLLIVDWVMPQKDAEGLILGLRAQAATAKLPILVLSSRSDKNIILKALQAGASQYLLKPWSEEDLAEKLQRMVE